MSQQQTSTRPAQSSIRSFFQPLLQTQPSPQPKPQIQSNSTSSTPRTTALSPKPSNHQTPPPPSRPANSYALPPSAKSATLPPPPPTSRHNAALKSASALHREAAILPFTKDHITPLRRINALLLPITYPDSFYHAILAPSSPATTNFSRVITWEDKVVGGIVCRLEKTLPSVASPFKTPTSPLLPHETADDSSDDDDEVNEKEPEIAEYDIYIQSLCLLSPYRSKGLTTHALNAVLASAIQEASTNEKLRIRGLYAHVWTSNEEALTWYSHRGFSIYENGVVGGYYRRLKPDTAYILRRELKVADHLAEVVGEKLGEVKSNHTLPKAVASRTASSPVPPPPPSNTPASGPSKSTTNGTTKLDPSLRPPPAGHSRSFQDRGPDREWNDLPEDVLGKTALVASGSSNVSSRSSSRSGLGDGNGTVGKGKKKRERLYPAAAFAS